HHFNSALLPGGYLGVDVFYVISGYVITSSILRTASFKLGSFLADFYARRVKRLMPSLLLCVVTSSILISLFDPDPRFSLETGIAALFGVSNLYLINETTNYFGSEAALNVFTHTWSLGVEEQFYLIFPFLIWIMFRIVKVPKYRILILFALATLSALMFMGAGQFAFYLMPPRFWELSAGAIAYLTERYIDNAVFRISWTQRLATLALVGLFAVLILSVHLSFCSLFSVVALAALIITSSSRSLAYKALTLPIAIWIGRISYSLYLWHWPVLVISRWTIGISLWLMPFQLTVMILLASASYYYLEKPLRYRVWSVSLRRTVAYATCATVSVAIALVALVGPWRGYFFTGTALQIEAVGTPSLMTQYSLSDGSTWRGGRCILSDNGEVGKVIDIVDCTLGNFSTANRRVLVIGNSFSTAFVHAFDDLVLLDGHAVTITSSWGASAVQEIPNLGARDKANTYYWAKVVPALAANFRRGDWVFLINDMHEFSPKTDLTEADKKLSLLEMGLRHLSEKLNQKGLHLAVLHGNPFAREARCAPVQSLNQWFAPSRKQCQFYSKEETLKRRSKLDSILVKLERNGYIRIVDLFEVFCFDRICTYEAKNGQMLYRDEWSHPSVEAARLSAPIIRKVLTASYGPYVSGHADADFH